MEVASNSSVVVFSSKKGQLLAEVHAPIQSDVNNPKRTNYLKAMDTNSEWEMSRGVDREDRLPTRDCSRIEL